MKITKYFKKLLDYGAMVMFSHSIFSASFAVAAAFFASRGIPDLVRFIWIMVAFIGARTFANSLNRIIDRKIDAENPRTAERHLPAGTISLKEALIICIIFFAIFILGAVMLPPICILLSPVAGIMMFIYSYTKRFTWLCHFFLGATCACASIGGWLGITGSFQWQMWPLAFANGAWVTGFDIIYAVQDMEHDRKKYLHSIPARFGKKIAFLFAVILHLASLLFLLLEGFIMESSFIYFSGIVLIAVLFIFQHTHTLYTAFKNVNFASYSVSKIVGIVLLISSIGDAFYKYLLITKG